MNSSLLSERPGCGAHSTDVTLLDTAVKAWLNCLPALHLPAPTWHATPCIHSEVAADSGRAASPFLACTGNQATLQFKQTMTFFQPLFKLLKRKAVLPEMVAGLDMIVEDIKQRNYLHAYDIYMRLAIGGVPSVMPCTGVTSLVTCAPGRRHSSVRTAQHAVSPGMRMCQRHCWQISVMSNGGSGGHTRLSVLPCERQRGLTRRSVCR